VALYFHCVWRWRVAHFDAHNDISRAHHEVVFAARLRNGHDTVVRNNISSQPGTEIARAGRVICSMLGGKWSHQPVPAGGDGHVILVFHAGRICVDTATGVSGTMIARVQRVTGIFQVLFLGGHQYNGKMTGGHRASHLGLLKGLRACKRFNWSPVHVVGDNKVKIRQYESRTPPRAAALKTPYWAARRTADAVGVESWQAHPREYNKTSHLVMQAVMATQQGLEWVAGANERGKDRWASVLAPAGHDTRHWATEHEKTVMDMVADCTV
jgi:ribonuclease HI